MALSARTRLTGTVTSVDRSDVVSAVTIELADGQTVTATITTNSVERLGVEEGEEATAVVNASDVM
ncbi:MAG: molybdopterin-binding protein [Halanaeroarchaeum sp.]